MKKMLFAVAAVLFLTAVNLYAAPGDVSVDGYLYVPNRPAFSVSLYQDWCPHEAGVIIFDRISVNNGNHYNPSIGRFTAPVSGLYQFCFGGTYYEQYGVAYIQVNGTPVYGGGVGSWYTGGGYFPEFKCLILNLTASDYVNIFNQSEYSCWDRDMLFSGHLL